MRLLSLFSKKAVGNPLFYFRLGVLLGLLGLGYWYRAETQRELEVYELTTARQTSENEVLVAERQSLEEQLEGAEMEVEALKEQLDVVAAEVEQLRNDDQRVRNDELAARITEIENTYHEAVEVYESLVELMDLDATTEELIEKYAAIVALLAKREYELADKEVKLLAADVQDELRKRSVVAQTSSILVSNIPANSGYRRQQVQSRVGTFVVDLIAGNIASTRVIVDTASDSTCTDNCPVLPLGTYVSRSGGYAGINGSFFCPASYPSCVGKTNSFDTLLMNKNNVYFNSDNNIYSTVPAVIFGGSYVRFVSRSLEWGRGTDIDSMIANQPLLVSGGQVAFGGDGDPKKGSRTVRSFVAHNGNVIYIGVVYQATVVEVAHVLVALGMDNAINLDGGGSTALWHHGYKAGPGRNIPNAIVFVRK